MNVLAVGEILWDIFPDGERLGGAPFNFAVHMHRLGHEVIFASAVGDDDRGRRALRRMSELGLSTDFVSIVRGQPTGTVSVSLDRGEPDYVIHRPAAYDFLEVPQIEADWLYFGTLAWLKRAATIGSGATPKMFYDLNLRKDSYTQELVETLLRCADVVKLNENELAYTGRSLVQLRDDYSLDACCVTRGERGCAILVGDDYAECPGVPITVADPVGAGDAFAAAFLHGLDQRWPAKQIGEFANQAGAFVASRPGAIPN